MGREGGAMTTWNDVAIAQPDLAGRAAGRFEATGLAFMATIRTDGSPRLSGVEPLFALDELWLGMMPDGRKSADLRRDPRLALHNASVDKAVTEGDAKVSGVALAVDPDDADTFAAYRAAFAAEAGEPPPPGPFDLWRVDVTGLAMITPGGDHLVIESWRPDRGYRRIERR
jgi:hypothetical protein